MNHVSEYAQWQAELARGPRRPVLSIIARAALRLVSSREVEAPQPEVPADDTTPEAPGQ